MQSEGHARARRAVKNYLSEREIPNVDLVRLAGVDKGTVSTFLSGESWPRSVTLGRIEKALGWPVGTISDIAEGLIEGPPTSPQPPVRAVDWSAVSNAELAEQVRLRLVGATHTPVVELSPEDASADVHGDGLIASLPDDVAPPISPATPRERSPKHPLGR